MGDRGNVQMHFRSEYSPLFLYTHWGGSDLPVDLRDALAFGKGRWGDDSYLARIIVSQIVGNDWGSETGYGLSPYITDNEHPELHVYLTEQRVQLVDRSFTFPEYVALSDDEIEAIWGQSDEDDDD